MEDAPHKIATETVKTVETAIVPIDYSVPSEVRQMGREQAGNRTVEMSSAGFIILSGSYVTDSDQIREVRTVDVSKTTGTMYYNVLYTNLSLTDD